MLTVEGYQLTHVVYSDNDTHFVRGHHKDDGHEKLLHIISNLDSQKAKHIQRYFLRSRDLQHTSLIQYQQKIETPHQVALITELNHYSCLSKLLDEQTLSLSQVLNFSIQLINSLQVIHKQGYCHGNIHLNSILINSQLDNVKWIAHTLPLETRDDAQKNIYRAPETINNYPLFLDARSDLYSFGLVLYQMLSGSVLLGDNLATTSLIQSLSQGGDIKPHLPIQIPIAIQRVVKKLLTFNPDDRYQNCKSLLSDLQKLVINPKNKDFSCARNDLPLQLHNPAGIYGRDMEVLEVFKYYQQALSGHTNFLAISGYSGIGKTSVVDRAHQVYFTEFCLFAKGKFDQISRRVPYSAFIQSLSCIIDKVLLLPRQEKNSIAEKIRKSIGEHIELLVGPLPKLKKLLEKPTTATTQRSTSLAYESDFQFKGALVRLIKCFCTSKRPLVLFLDDLQWADDASLAFINEFLSENQSLPMLLIGAYRDNELKPKSSLDRFLIASRAGTLEFNEIHLQPLNDQGVKALITDVLALRDKELEKLLHIVKDKTGSNPFFILQFLGYLLSNNCIEYHSTQFKWNVNFNKLQKLDITENVIDLVRDKIAFLPRVTANKIKILSYLGHYISIDDFSKIVHVDKNELMIQLQPAFNDSLITFVSGSDSHSPVTTAKGIECRFNHDRIQQGAYELIDPSVSTRLHKRLGNSYLALLKSNEKDIYLFNALEHLNLAKRHITLPQQKIELAELNLEAARKSKRALAYEEAIEFCRQGSEFIHPHQHSRLAYDLTLTLCESLFLSGQGNEIEHHHDILISQATDASQKATVTLLYIRYWASLGKFKKALTAGLKILNELSVNMPNLDASLEEVNKHYQEKTQELHKKLGARPVSDLFNIKLNQDKTEWIIIKIFSEIIDCSLNAVPIYTRLITINMINRGLDKGHTPYAPLAYVFQGMVMVSLQEDFEQAYELGALAVRLNDEKLKNDEISCKLITAYSTDLYHIKNSLQDSPYFYEAAYLAGLEQRDHVWCSYALLNEIRALLSAGRPLQRVITTIEEREPVLLGFNATAMFDLSQVFKGLVLALGKANQLKLDHGGFSEDTFLKTYGDESPLILSWYRFLKIKLSFLLGNYHQHDILPSIDSINVHEEYIEGAFYQCIIEIKHQNKEISLAKQHPKPDLENKIQHIQKIAVCNPKNFMTFSLLLLAELSKSDKDKLATNTLYEQAIHAANISGLVYQKALAYQLMGDYHYQNSHFDFAHYYLSKANHAYQEWGASNIISSIEKRYPKTSAKNSHINSNTARSPLDNDARIMEQSQAIDPPPLEELKVLVDQLGLQNEQGTVSKKMLSAFIESAKTKTHELSNLLHESKYPPNKHNEEH